MNRDQAEVVALQALGFLASDDELLGTFLAASGADLADLKMRARDPGSLGAVLDFLLQEDKWVLDFAQSVGLQPMAVAEARRSLPGGQNPHWT